MLKRLLLILLLAQLPLTLINCTSKDAAEEGDDAVVEESSADGEEGEATEEGEEGEAVAADESTDSSAEEAPSADTPPASDAPVADVAAPAENVEPPTEPTTGEIASTEPEVPATPATSEPSTPDYSSSASTTTDTSMGTGLPAETEAPKVLPLLKAASTPYKKGDVLVNAIYVARSGDTAESISQKIYGTDKTNELKKVNPFMANRDVKVGDKVYYNSPQRPQDDAKLLTYYEDAGVAPEIYVAKPGDNIRTVSKELLGDSNSWKEVWATNPDIESKGEIAEGTQLRYWKDTGVTNPLVGGTTSGGMDTSTPPSAGLVESSAPSTPPAVPDSPQDMGSLPPPAPAPTESLPPPADIAQNASPEMPQDLPPPTADLAPPPPPPPPAEEMAPPPPPPPPPAQASAEGEEGFAEGDEAAMSNDEVMQMAAGGVGALALVGYLIMRRRRAAQAAMEQSYMDTNVGT